MACTVHELAPLTHNFVTFILMAQCQYVNSMLLAGSAMSQISHLLSRNCQL